MTGAPSRLMAQLALTAGVLSYAQAIDASSEPLRFALSLHDYVGVPPEVMAFARERVARIYRAAGVEILWLTRDETTDPPHLSLHTIIVSRAGAGNINPHHNVLGVVARMVCRRGMIAYAYYDGIERFAEQLGHYGPFGRGQILGHVIAHEIGHLLLRSDSHSAAGIMRRDWDGAYVRLAAQGVLRFPNDQSKRIRATIVGYRPSRRNAARAAASANRFTRVGGNLCGR